MDQPVLKVQMLGTFSISLGDVSVNDNSNRSRKIWLLLAYLAYNRNRSVSQEELVNLLWGNGEENDNPAGALKTAFWRARQMLEPLGPSIGKELILRKGGGCRWNPEIPIEVDTEQFEALCRAGSASEDEGDRLDAFRDALALYQGGFLEKMSMEAWVSPISAYYHNVYISTLLETLPLLEERNRFAEVEELCRGAMRADPYNEILHQHLLRSLLDRGEYEQAAATYEEVRELLYSNLGIDPAEETQLIHREALRNITGYALLPDAVREQLREETPSSGAIVCEYSFFKLFYQAEARAAARRGDAVHIGIFSVTDEDGKELARRSLDRAMENLQVQIQRNLRKSDVVSRCSASQFVVLLLQANYENSCMVCDRIVRAFSRTYPHSPAKIHPVVMPLELSGF